MDSGELASDDRAVLDQTVSHIEDRVKILRDAEPYLLDMSAREASLSSYLGHMLSDKVELYRMTCDLGFHDIGLPKNFCVSFGCRRLYGLSRRREPVTRSVL